MKKLEEGWAILWEDGGVQLRPEGGIFTTRSAAKSRANSLCDRDSYGRRYRFVKQYSLIKVCIILDPDWAAEEDEKEENGES